MAKDIPNTSDLTNGAYEQPTGVDNGPAFSKIVTDFMKRMATHTHTGADSKAASLPQKISEIFLASTLTFTQDSSSKRYSTVLVFSSIDISNNNAQFYYKETADASVESSWIRFYPSELRAYDGTSITLQGLSRNDIDIRVIA